MELARDHYLDVLLPYCSIPGKACEMEIGDAFQRCCRTMRYLARPMNIVDLLAIFPFWLDILLALLGNDASNDSLAVKGHHESARLNGNNCIECQVWKPLVRVGCGSQSPKIGTGSKVSQPTGT